MQTICFNETSCLGVRFINKTSFVVVAIRYTRTSKKKISCVFDTSSRLMCVRSEIISLSINILLIQRDSDTEYCVEANVTAVKMLFVYGAFLTVTRDHLMIRS